MTCREKMMQEHPEVYNSSILLDCPSDHGLAEDPEPFWCAKNRCKDCWDREATGMERPEFKYRNPEIIAKVVDVKEENGGLTVMTEPIIKDSGDRTQFETGAVRDMREGKGRFDLCPLEVMARMFDLHDGKSGVMDFLVYFMNTNSTHFLIKALDRFALDTYGKTEKEAYTTMFLEVAKHFEDGAKKYGENNWQKGIPVHCYIDSAVRHYLKWLRGDKDEPHDRAFCWNLMCCIWEVDYHKEKE